MGAFASSAALRASSQGVATSPGALQRALRCEALCLRAYLEVGGKEIGNIENAAHVERIRATALELAPQVGLTEHELLQLRQAMAYSDVGKNLQWVNGWFAQRFNRYGKIERPGDLDRSLLCRPHRYLEGVADWLRLYQRATGVALQLRDPKESRTTEALAEKIEVWGGEPFTVGGSVGGDSNILDRWQALRFVKIIFSGATSWFPIGLYFHEIPGYAAAYAWGADRPVLDAMFGHNGPETSALEDGRLAGEGLVPSFWGLPFFKPVVGPYPLPLAEDRLGYLHTAIDRLDQGGLVRKNGTFEGGVRKIFVDWIAKMQTPPVAGLREALEKLPRQSAQQVHYLAHHGQITGMEMVFDTIIARLVGVVELSRFVDWAQSEAGDGYTIYLVDGTHFTAPQEFVAGMFQHILKRLAQHHTHQREKSGQE